MGDRGNIVIKQYGERGYVYLYTHWHGYTVPETLQRALQKRWRWEDESYLARIIFDEMVGDQRGTESGFGVTTYLTDHEYDLLVVDTSTKRVHLVREPSHTADRQIDFDNPKRTWTFEEFIALDFGDVEFGGWRLLTPELQEAGDEAD